MADIIQDSDQFLVNRSDSVQTVSAENLMATIEDTDLMIINRADQVFTVSGEDVKDSLGGGQEINPSPGDITADPNFEGGTGIEADPYILKPIEVNPAGASGQSVELITVAVAGASEYDLVVWKDNSTGADDRFAQPPGVVDADGKWIGRLVYKDEPDTATDTTYTGDLQLGTAYFRWTVVQKLVANSAPIINSAVLTETNPAKGSRFTDQSFAFNVTMLNNGVPASEKQIDAYVQGSIATSFTSDEITNVAEDPTPYEQRTEYPLVTGSAPDTTYGIAFDGTDKWMAVCGYGVSGNYLVRGTGTSTPTWDDTYLQNTAALGYAGGNFYTVKSDKKGRWILFGYDGSNNLFRYSDDFGTTWTSCGLTGGIPSAAYPTQTRSVATDYEGRWVVVGGDGVNVNQYVFTSTDNGETWEWQLFAPGAPTGGNIQSCAFVDNTIVASNAQGGLYYVSQDFGTTWGAATAAPDLGGFYAITASSDSKVFVGATTTGPTTICRSVDLGASWQAINTTEKVTGCIPLGDGVWLALGDQRTFSLSSDDCLTFEPFSDFTSPDFIHDTFVYDYGPGGTVLLDGRTNANGTPYLKSFAGGQVELTIDGEKDLAFIEGVVNNGKPDGDPDIAKGSVNDINIDGTNSTIKLVNTTGTWATGQVVETATVTSDSTKLYVEFDSAGTVSDLSNTPKPYFTTDDPVNLVLTFPATFPSGDTPDDELPEGTTLTATVVASNSEGSSVGLSTVQPLPKEGPSSLPGCQLAGYDWVRSNSVTEVTNSVTKKFVNVASNYNACFGLSEDNELYALDYVPSTTFAPRLLGSFVPSIGADREVAQACCGYNGSMVLLTADGVLYRFGVNGFEPDPSSLQQEKEGLNIAGLTAFTAISDSNLCWSNKTKHCYSGSGISTLANIASVPGSFTEHAPLDEITFGLNPGVDILQISGTGSNYSVIPYLYVLFADGKLFINGALNGTDYLQMFAKGGSGQSGVMLLKEDGTIWEQGVSGGAAVQYDTSRTYLTAPCGYGGKAYIAVDSTGQWRNIPPNASTPSDPVLGLSQVTGNVTREDLDGWGTNVNHQGDGAYVVIPVLDGTRSTKNMEPHMLLEAKARFATYENRADVYQGEQAQQQRDDLNAQIAANLGISIAELKELVGEED